MMHIAPAPTGEPGNAPASYAIQISAATSFPSLVAPIFTLIFEPEVGPLARSTSERDITSFTGAPVFLESSTDSGSRYIVVLPPNPPPISAGTTLIFPGVMPSTCALSVRPAKAPWVEQEIVAWPSEL